jgi:hypothetical protein
MSLKSFKSFGKSDIGIFDIFVCGFLDIVGAFDIVVGTFLEIVAFVLFDGDVTPFDNEFTVFVGAFNGFTVFDNADVCVFTGFDDFTVFDAAFVGAFTVFDAAFTVFVGAFTVFDAAFDAAFVDTGSEFVCIIIWVGVFVCIIVCVFVWSNDKLDFLDELLPIYMLLCI